MTERRIDPIPEDELVAVDDTIIGTVFRRSLFILLVVIVLGGGAFWFFGRDDTPVETPIEKDPGLIRGLVSPAATIPSVRFTDVTESSGIDFVHSNGARGEKMLPETMGSGAAFLDYDGDGDQDILLVNGTTWPWDEPTVPPPTTKLYRNDGAGRFENVTAGSGLEVSFYGTGVACGDYDGDGDVDLYVTAVGRNRLFRNDDGHFIDVALKAGVGGDGAGWSTSAGFFDADADGDLDLWVCNYIDWSREIDLALNFTLNGTDRSYGPPTNFKGAHCNLYRNDGAGVFADITRSAGLIVDTPPPTTTPVGKSLALMPFDFDDDGLLDVLVANDTTRNFLFRNLGGGVFEEVGTAAGIAYSGAGSATGAMGVDAAFYRNDDDLAVGIGNFANEPTSFYVRQAGSKLFADEALLEGIGSPSRIALSFGLFFFDYDLDGRLDLLQTNGHLEEEINELQSSQHYRQPAQLFWNAGPDAFAAFAEVSHDELGDFAARIVGRGAAYADIDGDGDLDVLLTQTGGPPLLLRNDQNLDHHWLRLRLVGRGANRHAIGATVELTAGGVTQRRAVMPTRSYLSQCELPVTFGLGDSLTVERVEVRWPDGARQRVPIEGLDRTVVVRRAASSG